jgi:hypothetical protein
VRYGHLANNVVDRVIKASRSYIATLPNANEWREIPRGVDVGWTWSDPDWIAPGGGDPKPDPATTPTYRKIVTPAEFVDLFPPEAFMDIKNNLVGTNAAITKMYEYAFLKDTIDLNSPRLPLALAVLVQESSLTQQDADIILQGILEEP